MRLCTFIEHASYQSLAETSAMIPQDHCLQLHLSNTDLSTHSHLHHLLECRLHYRGGRWTTTVNSISCITLCCCIVVVWPIVAPETYILGAIAGVGPQILAQRNVPFTPCGVLLREADLAAFRWD